MLRLSIYTLWYFTKTKKLFQTLLSTIWVIYDIMAEQKEMSDTEKLIWVLVALFLGIIGAIVYYFVVKRGKYEVEIKVKKKEQKEE